MDEKPTPLNRVHSLSDAAFEQVELDFARGVADDWEIQRLIDTVRIQRQILRELFSYFKEEPMRLVVTADPIRRSALRELLFLANMDER